MISFYLCSRRCELEKLFEFFMEELSCNICKKGPFPQKWRLERHLKSKGHQKLSATKNVAPKFFECHDCNQVFKSPKDIQKHIRVEIRDLGFEKFKTFFNVKHLFGYNNQDILQHPIGSPIFTREVRKLVLR